VSPIGVGIGVLFLGETPNPNALLGLVFVVAGIIAIPMHMTMPGRRLSTR
jgi:drug/metabolite transporter (DMT)-like permease